MRVLMHSTHFKIVNKKSKPPHLDHTKKKKKKKTKNISYKTMQSSFQLLMPQESCAAAKAASAAA